MTDEQLYTKITTEIGSFYEKNPTAISIEHPRANVVAVKAFDEKMNILEWRFQFAVDAQISRSTVLATNTDFDDSWFDAPFSHGNFLTLDIWDLKDYDWCQKMQQYLVDLENNLDHRTNSSEDLVQK